MLRDFGWNLKNFIRSRTESKVFFPNLKAFYLYDAKLKTVSKDVLQYPSLRYLSLRNNELVTLDVDLFEYTPELEVIRFKLNLIQHVGLHLLSRLDNLKIALFNTNACIRMYKPRCV